MAGLWFYLDEEDEDEIYEKEDYEEPLLDKDELEELENSLDNEDEEIYCKQCGALVEDAFQCEICGWMVA